MHIHRMREGTGRKRAEGRRKGDKERERVRRKEGER